MENVEGSTFIVESAVTGLGSHRDAAVEDRSFFWHV